MIWGLILLTTAVLVAGFMPLLIGFLQRKAMLDIPNERSSHTIPTPRGGGFLALGLPWLGLVAALLSGIIPAELTVSLWSLAGALLVLMIISGLDDRLNLPQSVRLLVQAIAVSAVVFCLPQGVRVFPILPHFAEQILLVLGLIWMVNLTNFIDGIDGITSVNGLSTVIGFGLVAAVSPVFPLSMSLVGGGLLGFLLWNRPPARVFMGDVGSVALGLWLGYGLCVLSSTIGLIPALLCTLYPLADATYTLVKRALQKKKVWQAHREHFYQLAVQNGRTHGRVITIIFIFNMLCIGLAFLCILQPHFEIVFLTFGLAGFAFLARHFSRRPS